MKTKKIILLTFVLDTGVALDYYVNVNEGETPNAELLADTVKFAYSGLKEGKERFVIKHGDEHVVAINMSKVAAVEGIYETIDEQNNVVED